MNEWKVRISRDNQEVIVKGTACEIVSGGVLVITDCGQIVRSFAVGAWTEFEMVKRASSGYGG